MAWKIYLKHSHVLQLLGDFGPQPPTGGSPLDPTGDFHPQTFFASSVFPLCLRPCITHTQTHIRTRGVRVYPYPRVYPTRHVPAGMGRVRIRNPRVRVYPFLPVKNAIFNDVVAISNVFFLFLPFKNITYDKS